MAAHTHSHTHTRATCCCLLVKLSLLSAEGCRHTQLEVPFAVCCKYLKMQNYCIICSCYKMETCLHVAISLSHTLTLSISLCRNQHWGNLQSLLAERIENCEHARKYATLFVHCDYLVFQHAQKCSILLSAVSTAAAIGNQLVWNTTG